MVWVIVILALVVYQFFGCDRVTKKAGFFKFDDIRREPDRCKLHEGAQLLFNEELAKFNKKETLKWLTNDYDEKMDALCIPPMFMIGFGLIVFSGFVIFCLFAEKVGCQ